MIRRILPALLLVWLDAGCVGAQPAPDGATAALAAPTPASPVFADTVWLDNGTIKLGVSPSVGRITWFGFSDGENLLWINPQTVDTPPDDDAATWTNYGGDKVWNGPQALWPYFLPHRGDWPPDGHLDGKAWEVTKDFNTIRMDSPESPSFGVKIRRQIKIFEDGSVNLEQVFIKTKENYAPVQPWTVTQIRVPNSAALATDMSPADPHVIRYMGEDELGDELTNEAGYVVWRPGHRGVGRKAGTMGLWIAAQLDEDIVFAQFVDAPLPGIYPEHSNVQFFVSDEYAELELLGPLQGLGAGAEYTHRTRWGLARLSDKGVDWASFLEAMAANAGRRHPVGPTAPAP